MPSRKGEAGVAGELARAREEAGPLLPLADAEQLALGIDAGLDRVQAVQQARKVGRPKGAIGKGRADFRRYFLSKYAHPADVLGQVMSRPVDVLQAELGCTRLEALQLQQRAAAELLPYLEGKMPVTIDMTARSDVHLVVPGLNAPLTEDLQEALSIIVEGEQIQGDDEK
jgi:hypothetical protein